MKLKTKFQDEDFDLGEVVDGVIVECLGKHEEKLRVIATAAKGGKSTFYYSSIKKFMDDWEDVPEEPKGIKDIYCGADTVYIEMHNEKEVVEAVEKLKAWQRLKDKGFKFDGWEDLHAKMGIDDFMLFNRNIIDTDNVIGFRMDDYHDCIKDLNICFGGKE